MQNDPNARQVGGTHYAAKFQHWDYVCEAFRSPDYFIGQATKYLARWRKKAGKEDLEKARHYYDKLVSLYQENKLPAERYPSAGAATALNKFFAAQVPPIPSEERRIFVGLTLYRNLNELLAVGELLARL